MEDISRKFDNFLQSSEPYGWPLIVGAAAIILLIVILCICCCITCKGRKRVAINPGKTAKKNNRTENLPPLERMDPKQDLSNKTIVAEDESINPPAWATIHPDSLQVDYNDKLGSGNFGIVYKGNYRNATVAVKTLKPDLDAGLKAEFWKELKVMGRVGKHKNIVSFLGAVIPEDDRGDVKVVLELCPHGSLKDYLIEKKNEVQAAVGMLKHQYTNVGLHVNTLCFMALQIAEGMAHLAEKHIVHGDLAARNVLVFDNDVVKISDFGLSKNLYSNPAYIKSQNYAVPWRWISVETQERLEFSEKADVWSYGVTLWEIFSMGERPYPHVFEWYPEFLNDLKSRRVQLEQPELAPDDIFGQIMQKCWSFDPRRRPTFRYINEFFRIR